eukprot:1189876-Prorocentrum_minimum.AAC.3
MAASRRPCRNLVVLALWVFSGPQASVAISLSDSQRASAFVGYSEKHVGSWDTVTDKEFLTSEAYKNLSEPILLSKSPCAILLPNFIQAEDAEEMIKRATPKLRSQRFHDQPDTRTSWGTVLWGNDPLSGGTVKKSEELVRATRSDGLEVKVRRASKLQGRGR